MPKPKLLNIDADLGNADWIKRLTWDLPTEKEMFLAVIGGEEALAHFMTLPAAEAMPDNLAQELGVVKVTEKALPRVRAVPVVKRVRAKDA